MRCSTVLALLLLSMSAPVLQGQPRSMAQDSTLDNLRHPPGTTTVPFGTLGRVRRSGDGPRTMLLIPGIGFGDAVWNEFMERHGHDYTMYAITLPGFGGTHPLAMPPDGLRYADVPWIRSALLAIETLLDREGVQRVTVVAHWALASQLAIRLALDHPDRVDAVVLVGGVLKAYFDANPAMLTWAPAQRSAFAEGIGQRWFKTVTRTTWDDNNFMSYDYAVNPRRGLHLWREAQAPMLQVWIRYLLEFYTMDPGPGLKELRVPMLVVQPGFDDPGFYVEPGLNYMRSNCVDSWRGTAEINPLVRFVTVPRSRLFVMHDQPDELDRVLADFLAQSPRPSR